MSKITGSSRWLALLLATSVMVWGLSGCPRKQTLLDDRPLEEKPHVETADPIDRADPFRP